MLYFQYFLTVRIIFLDFHNLFFFLSGKVKYIFHNHLQMVVDMLACFLKEFNEPPGLDGMWSGCKFTSNVKITQQITWVYSQNMVLPDSMNLGK